MLISLPSSNCGLGKGIQQAMVRPVILKQQSEPNALIIDNKTLFTSLADEALKLIPQKKPI
jgi:hypothetical protein